MEGKNKLKLILAGSMFLTAGLNTACENSKGMRNQVIKDIVLGTPTPSPEYSRAFDRLRQATLYVANGKFQASGVLLAGEALGYKDTLFMFMSSHQLEIAKDPIIILKDSEGKMFVTKIGDGGVGFAVSGERDYVVLAVTRTSAGKIGNFRFDELHDKAIEEVDLGWDWGSGVVVGGWDAVYFEQMEMRVKNGEVGESVLLSPRVYVLNSKPVWNAKYAVFDYQGLGGAGGSGGGTVNSRGKLVGLHNYGDFATCSITPLGGDIIKIAAEAVAQVK